jgi:DNA-binding response OmpR family regulator
MQQDPQIDAAAALRVLIVDDEPGIRLMLTESLALMGYEPQEAVNGRAALQKLEGWQPDVILLDLMMPELDGWGFRAEQLAHAEWAQIPVIVLSARHNLQRGIDVLQPTAVIPKPFQLGELFETLETLTRRETEPEQG